MRQVIFRGSKRDHGLGPGILYTDEIEYTDPSNRNRLNTPLLEAQAFLDAEELLSKLFEVKIIPKKQNKPNKNNKGQK